MNGCWILLHAFNSSVQLSFFHYSVNVSNYTDILMLYQQCELNSIGPIIPCLHIGGFGL